MQISSSVIQGYSLSEAPRPSTGLQGVDAESRQSAPNATGINNVDIDTYLKRRSELNAQVPVVNANAKLAYSQQQAIATFEANLPSVEQRFGIEFVGIDTYA